MFSAKTADPRRISKLLANMVQRAAEMDYIAIGRGDLSPKMMLIGLCLEVYEKCGGRELVSALIGEYGAPIVKFIEEPEKADKASRRLPLFFELKSQDTPAGFIFITGVSRFAYAPLFSSLNNLTDLALNPNYAAIRGFAEEDVGNIPAIDRARPWASSLRRK